MEINIVFYTLVQDYTDLIKVLIARNTILSNRIEDAHIENDRLRRENKSLEKENDELFDKLDKMEVGT